MFLCTVITAVNIVRIALIIIGESVDNPCEKTRYGIWEKINKVILEVKDKSTTKTGLMYS
jgi:hypothetical protein